MATRFSLSFYGDQQLDRTLARFERVADMTPVWDTLADRFAALERRQFRGEGKYASGGWPALSPAYGKWKARHYPGQPILQREGDLYRSLTQRPFGVEHLTPSAMAVGSDIAYGAYHQHGGRRLPRRRPVEFPESERREWVKLIQRFIVTGGRS